MGVRRWERMLTAQDATLQQHGNCEEAECAREHVSIKHDTRASCTS